MSVRPIVLFPDSGLKTKCVFSSNYDSISQTVADLIDTMDACPPRTVGIAAPQIGVLDRVAVVDASRNPKHPSSLGLIALIDPLIIEQDGIQDFREGCLSIPEYTANIRRSLRITVRSKDIHGNTVTLTAEGFEAVVIQHEIDHLDGILFLDRVSNLKTDLFRRKTK